MTLLTGKCPTGCGRKVQPRKLMCFPCWKEVPGDLQRAVYRTFKAWWADRGDAEKLLAYDEARDAAIGSIR